MEHSIDREKVIGHLNDCIEASRRDNTWVFVRKDIVEDSIALLKEQAAVKPVFECEEPTLKIGQFHCGNCHQSFGISRYRFCPFCGKPVQWE